MSSLVRHVLTRLLVAVVLLNATAGAWLHADQHAGEGHAALLQVKALDVLAGEVPSDLPEDHLQCAWCLWQAQAVASGPIPGKAPALGDGASVGWPPQPDHRFVSGSHWPFSARDPPSRLS